MLGRMMGAIVLGDRSRVFFEEIVCGEGGLVVAIWRSGGVDAVGVNPRLQNEEEKSKNKIRKAVLLLNIKTTKVKNFASSVLAKQPPPPPVIEMGVFCVVRITWLEGGGNRGAREKKGKFISHLEVEILSRVGGFDPASFAGAGFGTDPSNHQL